jgi:hypothetical protein
MNILRHTFPSGLVLEIPDQILITQGYENIAFGNHYCLKLGKTTHTPSRVVFDVTHKNGKNIAVSGMYILPVTLAISVKYEPLTLERFIKTRIFL